MRCSDGYEGGDSDWKGLEVRKHISSVEAAHAMCDDGDGLRGWRMGFKGRTKGSSAVGDRGGRRHGRCQDCRSLCGEGISNAMPILDGWEVRCEAKLSKAEEAMSKDDGIFWRLYRMLA